jgi:hypothetical protein
MERIAVPSDVQAAEERMQRARAAVRAAAESDEPDRQKRRDLIEELRLATDDYVRTITRPIKQKLKAVVGVSGFAEWNESILTKRFPHGTIGTSRSRNAAKNRRLPSR